MNISWIYFLNFLHECLIVNGSLVFCIMLTLLGFGLQVKMWFKRLDLDEDGVINWDEF